MKIFVIFFITYSLIIINISYSQQDPEAKKILDKFSEKTKSFKAYQATFTIISENHQNGDKSESKGSILIRGDKYKMLINKTEVYFDGKVIFNFSTESNEVSIVKPNKKKEDIFPDNPTKLFNIYTTDYKFHYLGDITENGRECYEVDLYPNDIKKKYSIVKLLIDKVKLELVSSKLIMKSGVHYIVNIDSFNSQANASDQDFVFDIKAHKGIEVVDLR